MDLEAAKAVETTFFTTDAAESRAGALPAVVSEKLQSKSNISWTGVTVTASTSEG